MSRWQEAADGLKPNVRGCRLYQLIQSQDDFDRTCLLDILKTETYADSARLIQEVTGLRIAETTISRHMKGEHQCPTG